MRKAFVGKFVIILEDEFQIHRRSIPCGLETFLVISDNAPRVSGTPGPCGERIVAQVDLVSLRPARNAADACEDCDSDRSGISKAYKECG
ncbi:hypothetical protein L3X38_026269 [Prunus dulcis]|uniref:Uncharacterized protein n=1 Tax=Prunus dulcis TaxID=3755 RepID=A0AAD4YJM1_PRUDU|nr:hypothetical protein L3X38_026269 [Prunus dulcis]